MNQQYLNVIVFIVCGGFVLFYVNSIISAGTFNKRVFYRKNVNISFSENFDDFNNEIGTNDGRYIVPNYIHFLRFGLGNISFIDAVCILAALKNQKPDKLFIHTDEMDVDLGKYWDLIMDNDGFRNIEFKKVILPTEIFGKELSKMWRKWHGGDVTRLRILMKYGGIFLDNDSYVVRSLNDFRRYEMTLGWMNGSGLANQVIIAHKNARFLRKWLESYKGYDSTQWYYNAGIKPTKEILDKQPYLIHREKYLLANHKITHKLYLEKWNEWRSHYAIHLLYNHQYILNKNLSSLATYPVKFDEYNIVYYPVTIRDMVFDVFPRS